MRYVLLLASLVAIPATAQTPGLLYKVGCEGSNIVVFIKANEPNLYRIEFPADVCGKFL